MKTKLILPVLVFLLLGTAFELRAAGTEPPLPRSMAVPTNAAVHRAWAVKLDLSGLKNFHQVTTNLYRCAQPGAEGMRQLEKLGVKTVINLRAFHGDAGEVKSTALRQEHIYFKTWHPEDEDVVRFLKIVTDTNRAPFVVHCQHGSDRTGTMIAIYRMAVQGWTKDEAIDEMTKGGFGFHPMWKNLTRYLRALDLDALKKRARINPAPRPS